MRTTIDLPEELLSAVQSTTSAKTRREALIIALEDYVQRQRRLRLIKLAGSLEFDVDPSELRRKEGERLKA